MKILILLLLGLLSGDLCGQDLTPRGVSPHLAPFYDSNKNFQCLDGSDIISFSKVNDDYCDCADGSDEPGTSACSNGKFYCENAGHKASYIYSSRVNDGICDCCDGSDEWNSENPCTNNCMEIGEAARAENARQVKMIEEGLKLKEMMISEGTELMEKLSQELRDKEARKAEAENRRRELEEIRNKAEAHESEALDIYRKEEKEKKLLDEEEGRQKEDREIETTFNMLDTDGDGKIDSPDLQHHLCFDQNKDGQVSPEEATFFMSGFDSYDIQDFKTVGWELIKPYIRGETQIETQPPTIPEYDDMDYADESDLDVRPTTPKVEEDREHQEETEEEEEEDEDDDGDEDLGNHDDVDDRKEEDNVDSKYDPETQKLIDAADKARADYNEADRIVRDLEHEVKDLKEDMTKDFGPQNEFLPLNKKCFELSENEYIYKICVFDYCSQKSKNGGGGETRLGNWEHWIQPYTEMKYSKGLQCWNGPMRSTVVKISCGSESKLFRVTEPNKCEYEFNFESPAACQNKNDLHDEL